METTFELNDTLYARAHLEPTEKVHLWLGVRTFCSRGYKGVKERERERPSKKDENQLHGY